MRKFRRYFAIVLAALLIMQSLPFHVLPVKAAAAKETNLKEEMGDIYHYNGLVFGNYISYQADVGGALAIGGRAMFGLGAGTNYSIGKSGTTAASDEAALIGDYNNDNGYPSLMVNQGSMQVGSVSEPGPYTIYDGPLLAPKTVMDGISGSALNKFVLKGNHNDLKWARDEWFPEWFEENYNIAAGAAKEYPGANDVEITLNDFKDGQYYKQHPAGRYENKTLKSDGKIDTGVLSVNVQTGTTLNFNGQSGNGIDVSSNWAADYDLIVFSFPNAVNVNITNGTMMVDGEDFSVDWTDEQLGSEQAQIRKNISEKVIWNFPSAKTIHMEHTGLMGTVLAPEAYLYAAGGSINGQLICNSFTAQQGMELRSFSLTSKAFEITKPEEAPEPSANVEIFKYELNEEENSIEKGPLAGALFRLYKYNNNDTVPDYYGNENYITDQYGRVRIKDLPIGRYRIIELTAPEGYLLNNSDRSDQKTFWMYEFELKESDEGKWVNLERYNKPITTELTLKKVAEGSNTGLEGAKFNLYKYRNASSSNADVRLVSENIISGSDGNIALSGLSVGTYRLVETEAPEGHSIKEEDCIEFRVTFDTASQKALIDTGSITNVQINGEEILIENKDEPAKKRLTIYAENAASPGTLLSGVKYKAKKYNEVTQEWEDYQHEINGGSTDTFEVGPRGYLTLEDMDVGTYCWISEEAPDGYQCVNAEYNQDGDFYYAEELTVVDDETYYTFTVSHEPYKTEIEIYKVDKEQNPLQELAIENVEFTLYKVSGDILVHSGQGITDQDGLLKFENLTQGDYELREITAPEGYKDLTEEISISVAFDAAGNATIKKNDTPIPGNQLEVENKPYLGSVKITKIDSEIFREGFYDDPNSEDILTYLPGATFTVNQKNANGEWIEFIDETGPTDTNGELTISNLPLGDYQVIEKTRPNGYRPESDDSEVASFSITKEVVEEDAPIELLVVNYKDTAKGPVRIKKEDFSTGDPIAGTVFRLWKIEPESGYNGPVFEGNSKVEDIQELFIHYESYKYVTEKPLVSDENGIVDLGNLSTGTYLLFESIPTKDYTYLLEPGATVAATDDISWYYHSTAFEVAAVDESNKDEGIKVEWVDKNKISWQEVKEYNEVINYSNPDDIHFTITGKKEGTITTKVVFQNKDNEDEILNESVYRLFMDKNGDGKFTDAEIIQDDIRASSNDEFELDELLPGSYKLEEVTTSDGYKKGEPVYFELVINGFTKVLDLYNQAGNIIEKGMDDEGGYDGDIQQLRPQLTSSDIISLRLKEDVTLYKVDEDDHPLPGAVFELYQFNDPNPIEELVTREDGKAVIHDLEAGEYTLKEKTAPIGYEAEHDEFEFELSSNAEQTGLELAVLSPGELAAAGLGITITNKKAATMEVTIFKVGEADINIGLEDAVFALYRGETYVAKGKTKNDGTLTFENLIAGDYKLVEEEAPEGHAINKESVEFKIEKSGNELQLTSDQLVNDQIKIINKEQSKPIETVTLFKYDETDNTSLGGAKFELLYSDDGISAYTRLTEFVTEEGIVEEDAIRLSGLVAGYYKLVETQAPYGYKDEVVEIPFELQDNVGEERLKVVYDLNDVKGATVEDDTSEQERIITIKVPATPFVKSVQAVKVDEKTEGLEGAVFDVEKYNSQDEKYEKITEVESSSSGILTIDDLRMGLYQLVETKAPAGYQKDSKPITFELTVNESNNGLDLIWDDVLVGNSDPVITNNALLMSIIVKTLDDDGLVSGSKFTLTNADDSDFKVVHTIAVGEAEFADLKLGTYELTETSTASGYVRTDKIEFVIKTDASGEHVIEISGNEAECTGNVISIKKTVLQKSVDLSKEDSIAGGLSGAEFTLKEFANGEWEVLYDNIVTGTTGQSTLSNLKAGNYQLTETKAPYGYLLNNRALEFTLAPNQDSTELSLSYSGMNDAQNITVHNTRLLTDVSVRKIDSITEEPLPGAEFELYKEDGNNGYAATNISLNPTGSDGSFMIKNLDAGKYELRETVTPDEYLPNTSVQFEIKPNSESDGLEIHQSNVVVEQIIIRSSKIPPKTDVQVLKVDQQNKQGLPGAEFTLSIKEGDSWTPLDTGLTTVANGSLLLEEMEPGEYKLTETKAPKGYQVPEQADTFFSLKADQDNEMIPIKPIVIENVKISKVTGEITIHKTNISGQDLSGAQFVLYRKYDGHWIKEQESLISDQKGLLRIKDLPAGNYKLLEVKAPDGYLITNPDGTEFIMKEENGIVVPDLGGDSELLIRNQEGDIPPLTGIDVLMKKADESDTGLSGAQFVLYYRSNGEWIQVKDGIQSGNDGAFTLEDLGEGAYRLVEIAAPDGYLDELVIFEFEIVDNSGVLEYQQTDNKTSVINQKAPLGVVGVQVVDEETHIGLSGAEFQLMYDNGSGFIPLESGLTTDDTGNFQVDDLMVGNYRLIETKAPQNYQAATAPIEFELELNEDDVLTPIEPVSFWIPKQKKNSGGGSGSGSGTGQPDTGVEPEPDTSIDPGESPDPDPDVDIDTETPEVPGGNSDNNSNPNGNPGSDTSPGTGNNGWNTGDGKRPPLTGMYRDIRRTLLGFSLAGLFVSGTAFIKLFQKRKES